MRLGTDGSGCKVSAGYVDGPPLNSFGQNWPCHDVVNVRDLYRHERIPGAASYSQGSTSLTQVSSSEGCKAEGNVHSGAPPPWFTGNDNNQLDALGPKLLDVSAPKNPGKSSKLNPKRVGAAWADRRKIELERERKGEVNIGSYDPNWLPNFGRVWQSGSRKASRKEFQLEKKHSPEAESRTERPQQLQPYVSKRMRTETSQPSSQDVCEDEA